MWNDEGVATSSVCSVDGISGDTEHTGNDGESDKLDDGRETRIGRNSSEPPNELIDGITEGTCDNAGLTGRLIDEPSVANDLAGEFSCDSEGISGSSPALLELQCGVPTTLAAAES